MIVISGYGDSYSCDNGNDAYANYGNDTSPQILSKWIGMVVMVVTMIIKQFRLCDNVMSKWFILWYD